MKSSRRKPHHTGSNQLSGAPTDVQHRRHSARHFAIGWSGLALAMLGGMGLDLMLGFKVGMYLDVDNQTRRMMWQLAHAHAAGISLVHLGLAAYAACTTRWNMLLAISSQGLTVGLIAMPLGFFLGGLQFYGGDPGVGVFFVPLGGVALVVAVICTAIDAAAAVRNIY